MRRLLLAAAAFALSPVAFAGPPPAGNFGLGVGGGLGVSGLSGKYYVSDANAFQGVVGFWGRDNQGFGVGLDYLYEFPTFAPTEPVDIAWNLGLGASLGITEPVWLGASAVAGVEFLFKPIPLDLVIEYRPGVRILNEFHVDLINFSGHLRYYF